jgi:hypothetical protein
LADQIESDLPSGGDFRRSGKARADQNRVDAWTMMKRQGERVERGQFNHGYARRAASLQPPVSIYVRYRKQDFEASAPSLLFQADARRAEARRGSG